MRDPNTAKSAKQSHDPAIGRHEESGIRAPENLRTQRYAVRLADGRLQLVSQLEVYTKLRDTKAGLP